MKTSSYLHGVACMLVCFFYFHEVKQVSQYLLTFASIYALSLQMIGGASTSCQYAL